MSIKPELRMPQNNVEKHLLRSAFANDDLIPNEVLWREKEAFSDGVSGQKDSWFAIIQRHIDTIISDEEFKTESSKYQYCTPNSKEAYYYRNVFDSRFKGCEKVIPYFWMPNFTDAKDASARTLDIYKTKMAATGGV